MKYKAKPVTLVSVESGHINCVSDKEHDKKHVEVETKALSEIIPNNKLPNFDISRNVMVLSFEVLSDGHCENLALNYDDSRSLCRDILCHLATSGDATAMHLLCNIPRQSDDGCDNYGKCDEP